jgi:hypothetical protein
VEGFQIFCGKTELERKNRNGNGILRRNVNEKFSGKEVKLNDVSVKYGTAHF